MDGRYLDTDRGLLSLNYGSPDTYLHQDQSIFVNNEASSSALLNNMLVLGHASGQVTFIEFASP
ncbi:hypothetical protein Egran_03672 [Elaphomyces granulatus]|uniref:Uncharacterized protein n=1 Tax=Elaphomyces granulatus TaxID=519963 RepID=A0A232LWM9_9EURO|nr:hypothetical protein Egran_03672 [Elaphomyces granulatus]